MTSWGVPNEQAPLSIGGDIGILTSNALQIYSPHGERKNTLKLSNKVICSFTTGLKTNKFCLVTETPDGKKSLWLKLRNQRHFKVLSYLYIMSIWKKSAKLKMLQH